MWRVIRRKRTSISITAQRQRSTRLEVDDPVAQEVFSEAGLLNV
jgi:hypothetical protein